MLEILTIIFVFLFVTLFLRLSLFFCLSLSLVWADYCLEKGCQSSKERQQTHSHNLTYTLSHTHARTHIPSTAKTNIAISK